MIGQNLPQPKSNNFVDHLEWAGEMYADYAEGMRTDPNEGWWIWNRIVGWTDLGHTEDENRQLRTIATQLSDLLRNVYE
jgi:hypothetical protein